MKQIKESILSSTGTGNEMLIKKWLEETFGFKSNREGLSYTLDGGKVQIFGDVSDMYFHSIEVPDYIHINYFQPSSAYSNAITISVPSDKDFEKFKKFFKEVHQIGDKPFEIYIHFTNISKIKTEDFNDSKIFGKLEFEKCNNLFFTKGFPNATRIIIDNKTCKTILKPSGIGELTKVIEIL